MQDLSQLVYELFFNETEKLSREGKTPMYVAEDKKIFGIVACADKLKKDSIETINRLHKLNIKTVMITGDNKNTANAIANETGIDIVLSEVLPEEKSKEVKKQIGRAHV